MTDRFERSVAQVSISESGGPGTTRGTGFLVTKDVLVTCAHVLGEDPPANQVWVKFPQASGVPAARASLIDSTWLPRPAADVAFLRLESAVEGLTPLRLRSTASSPRTSLQSFGFPEQTSPDGHFGKAGVEAVCTHDGHPVLQLADPMT